MLPGTGWLLREQSQGQTPRFKAQLSHMDKFLDPFGLLSLNHKMEVKPVPTT